MRVKKAVIPVAGLGTRFLPATKAIPKEMIPIIDKPMIQYIVEECVEAGIEDIIFVTARGKDAILDHFDFSFEVEHTLRAKGKSDLLKICTDVSQMVNVTAVRQKEALGLGHAVLTARYAVGNEPFAVLLGDDLVVSKVPCIRQLIDAFEKQQKSVIGVMQVPREDVSKYGIVGGSEVQGSNGKLVKVDVMIEKPKPADAPSTLACPGRYVLTPKIFEFIEATKPGAGGEIQLTDALARLAKEQGLFAYLFDGLRYDTGDKLGYIEATIAFALDRPEFEKPVRDLLRRYSK